MSEKRYEAVMTYDGEEEGLLNEVMTPTGERWGPLECADLLNTQAEIIEIYRQWTLEMESVIRSLGCDYYNADMWKRRIAALDGE